MTQFSEGLTPPLIRGEGVETMYSTFVDNDLYVAISIYRALVFISAVAWISLLLFLIGNVPVVLFYICDTLFIQL